MAKWVYMFTEGNATMRNLLGGYTICKNPYGSTPLRKVNNPENDYGAIENAAQHPGGAHCQLPL